MVRRRELLARKFRTLRALPWSVIGWLPPVWAMIGLSAGLIAVVPFRRLAFLFGQGTDRRGFAPTLNPAQQRRVAWIGRTIEIAARYAPYRSDCYPQALTAAVMCRLWHLPYAMYFGLAANPVGEEAASGFSAHAWVTSGTATLTGGANSFARYRVVSCFVPPYALKA
jgi:hypothetical protein